MLFPSYSSIALSKPCQSLKKYRGGRSKMLLARRVSYLLIPVKCHILDDCPASINADEKYKGRWWQHGKHTLTIVTDNASVCIKRRSFFKLHHQLVDIYKRGHLSPSYTRIALPAVTTTTAAGPALVVVCRIDVLNVVPRNQLCPPPPPSVFRAVNFKSDQFCFKMYLRIVCIRLEVSNIAIVY